MRTENIRFSLGHFVSPCTNLGQQPWVANLISELFSIVFVRTLPFPNTLKRGANDATKSDATCYEVGLV